uniref:Uncharacterized protein n=2 Tax=Rhizophora mucronata TaxID=61149 RepID=A0A2P2IP17_RHIMU
MPFMVAGFNMYNSCGDHYTCYSAVKLASTIAWLLVSKRPEGNDGEWSGVPSLCCNLNTGEHINDLSDQSHLILMAVY